MNIWHITPYDTIPGEAWRPGRAITMCRMLAEHGHRVTWWTSNFSHFFKRFRSDGWGEIEVTPDLHVRLVPVPGYRRHVSLARLRFHCVFAWRLYRRARQERPPDCIIFASPSPGADYVSVKLAQRFAARLIVDVRDLWPELFSLAFPPALRAFAPAALYPLYALRRCAFQNADAVTAVTGTYLDVALRDAPHLIGGKSRAIYFGADVAAMRSMTGQTDSAETRVQKSVREIRVIYAGTLGDNYDIKTVLNAAVLLGKRASNIKVVIAGTGPLRDHVVGFIEHRGLDNVSYLGSLPWPELAEYYRSSDIGLSPYSEHSTVVMPAKVYDYMAAGLPIVSSLRGELEDLLKKNQMGVQYVAGDPESLTDVLTKLADDDDLRHTMAQNSYGLATRFDRQTHYLEFLDLL